MTLRFITLHYATLREFHLVCRSAVPKVAKQTHVEALLSPTVAIKHSAKPGETYISPCESARSHPSGSPLHLFQLLPCWTTTQKGSACFPRVGQALVVLRWLHQGPPLRHRRALRFIAGCAVQRRLRPRYSGPNWHHHGPADHLISICLWASLRGGITTVPC